MKKMMIAAALAACVCFGGAAYAQDPAAKAPEMSAEDRAMMEAFERMGKIRPEHERLQYFVGDWNVASKMWMKPGTEPVTSSAKATMKPIMGGRYIESDFTGDMMGQPFTGNGLTAFDNLQEKYLATWIDSMSTGIFMATGTYDDATKTYTYAGEMHDPMKPGTKLPVRIVEKIVGPDSFTFEWFESHDGKEAKTMEMTYTRAK